jgi:hypothetical protein
MFHEIICRFEPKRVHHFNLMFQEIIICLEHVTELTISDVYNSGYRNDTLTSLGIVNLDKCCSLYLVVGIKLGSQSQARNQRQLARLQQSSPNRN